MARYIDEKDVYALVEPSGTARVHCSQIDELPRADVAPKIEVAMDVFAKVRKAIYEVNSEVNNQLTKARRENDHIRAENMLEVNNVLRAVRRIIAEYENEYIQGTTGHEIFLVVHTEV